MLGRAADALRVWAERDARMADRIAELSKRLEEAERFDEARVTEVLGAETARIVAAARDAAAEMRDQAARESAEWLERSRAEAEAVASELRSAADADRAEAAKVRADAERSASELVADATTEAERARSSAREEAERTTAEADQAAEKLTSEARVRHDEMIEAAAKVLDERTEAAEAAASQIRATASEELEHARTTAGDELERAREEVTAILANAEADATATRDQAREQGREMVEEARELRRQMLRDIAERTRAARQKVEAAKAARSEVLSALRRVGGEIDRSIVALVDHDTEMRRAADSAAAGVPDDVELMVRELEERLIAVPAAPGARDAGLPEDRTGRNSGDVGPDDPGAGDDSGAASADADRDEPGIAGDSDSGPDGDSEPGPDGDPDAGGDPSATGEGDEHPGDQASQLASVHDLFEKLRSHDTPEGDEPDLDSAASSGHHDPQPEGHSAPTGVVASLSGVHEDDVLEAAAASSVVRSSVATIPAGQDSPATDTASGTGAASATEPVEQRPVDRELLDRQQLLDRRDALVEPAVRLFGRTLKRLLSDEQNEVLDQVRRTRKTRVEVSDLLGEEDSSEHFTDRLIEAYRTAATAGATLWSELSSRADAESVEELASPQTAPAVEVAQDPVVLDSLRAQVDEILAIRRAQLREVLESHSEAGANASELVDRLRSAYRDLRTDSVDELAGDLATGGFAAGTAVAAGPSRRWRWIPDNGGLPCADAEDNALEGPVACGSAFPTGDTRPPAHPGCRCIVVPAEIGLR